MLPYNKNLKEPARNLRKKMTEAEQALWSRLRGKQLFGIQFYRQKPIGPYIVDFFAPVVKLVVEADGSQHMETTNVDNDSVRDSFMKAHDLLVLRFDNRQILTEMDGVLEVISGVSEQRREIPLNPPFSKGDFNNRSVGKQCSSTGDAAST